MWVKAVEKAGTTDADAVIDALPGIETPNLTGGVSTMLPNHHITKPVLIGEIQADGQFEVGLRDRRPRAGRCLVGLPAGIQAAQVRLGDAEMRQLQHRNQKVPGIILLRPLQAGKPNSGFPIPFEISFEACLTDPCG